LQDIPDVLNKVIVPQQGFGLGFRAGYETISPEYNQYADKEFRGKGAANITGYTVPTDKTYKGKPLVAKYDTQGNFNTLTVPAGEYINFDPKHRNIVSSPTINRQGVITDHGVWDLNARSGGGGFGGFMGSIVESFTDAVSVVFDAVGDVVEDVVDFVGDTIDKVGDVVQAVIDDPLPVLLAVGGSFIGIPPYITSGMVTAAKGGDLEDIVLSAGTAYIGSSAGANIGNSISNTVTSTFVEAGANEAFSQVAGDAISKGLINATISEIKGGSFEDGFAGGFTGGMVAGGVGEVASYVKPDIIQLAQDSGLDLKDATAVYNASKNAFTAGVSAEVTGRGDFATSFTNSAVGSGVDYGVRSLNATIDEQFRTAATDWNDKDKQGEPVDVSITGAGIPNDIVSQVQISDIGVDNDAGTFSVADVLADSQDTQDVNNASSSYTGGNASYDISVLPETQLAQAPQAENVADFADTSVAETPASDTSVLAEAPVNITDIPEDVIDIAEELPEETPFASSAEPVGGLNALAEAPAPIVDLDTTKPAVVSEAPIAENLLVGNLAQDKTAEQPVGGLNAVAPQTAVDKMVSSLNLKPTDITKPLVATAGNLVKSALTTRKPPPRNAPPPRPTTGGLQAVRPKVAAPPQKVDVAKLIPIQKAQTAKKPTKVAPPTRLTSAANLTPISNIAGLTSQVKKTG